MSDPIPPLPTGLALTPLDDAYRQDPHAVHADLRRRAPVVFDPLRQAFVVTRYDDVRELLVDRTLSVDPRSIGAVSDPRRESPIPEREPGLLGLDDPRHRRLRVLVSKAFTPRSVAALRERIESIVDDVLEPLRGAEAFDLVEDFAGPIPCRVIAELMGLDPSLAGSIRGWTRTGLKQLFLQPSPEQWQEAAAADRAQRALFAREIADRRERPREDLISKLIAARDRDDVLSEDEVVTNCVLFMGAGNFTTTDLIGNGVRALLEHPEALAALRRRPESIAAAVEEMARFDGPVLKVTRYATHAREIRGVAIPAGSVLHLVVAAANRDPEVFPEPDRFDPTRSPNDHLAFGRGGHVCIGAPLARLEACIVIPRLLAAFPKLTLRDARTRRTLDFRGHSRLEVVTA